jgi:hypothetical protein
MVVLLARGSEVTELFGATTGGIERGAANAGSAVQRVILLI